MSSISTNTPNVINTDDIYLIQNDINTHITSQQELYTKLRNSEYVLNIDKENATTNPDLITPENIMDQITNLNEYTDELERDKRLQEIINAYFNYNYQNNTQLRNQYFEKINNLNKTLLEQNDELTKINPKLNTLQTNTSTQYRNLKEVKRHLAKQKYYNNLFNIITVSQIFSIIILILGYSKILPKYTVIISLTIIYLLLTLYVGYVVLFTNTDRDTVVFDRYRFPVNKNDASRCNTSVLAKKRKEKDAELNNKITDIITDTKSKCLATTSSTTTTTTTQQQ